MASVTSSLTNSENNIGLQYKILRTSSATLGIFDGLALSADGNTTLQVQDTGFELCVQEIERQVQAAIQEGFVPHGSLAHSFVTSFEGHTTLHMTQPMVRQQ